jgi:hypothetical protein
MGLFNIDRQTLSTRVMYTGITLCIVLFIIGFGMLVTLPIFGKNWGPDSLHKYTYAFSGVFACSFLSLGLGLLFGYLLK